MHRHRLCSTDVLRAASRLAAAVALLVTLAAVGGFRQASLVSSDDAGAPGTVLITGANRGLGLEFARQLKEAGYHVIATCRSPAEADDLSALGVQIEQLDVTGDGDVRALAKKLEGRGLDILINNAGISGGRRASSLAEVELDAVARVYEVNTIGPMRVTQALLPALRRGDRKIVVNITSALGSIERNTGGHYYGYRESKAALNMFTRSLAAELRPEGFTCIVMSPGWVRTDMGGPGAPLSPAESIRGMVGVIEKLTPADTGTFRNHAGETLAW